MPCFAAVLAWVSRTSLVRYGERAAEQTNTEGAMSMNKLIAVMAGMSLLGSVGSASAADHSLTAIAAGGLTESSQPFANGTINPGRSSDTVPGEGSPLSGEEHTTPAVEAASMLTHHRTELNTNANPGNGETRTPNSVSAGKTAPSGNSTH
jgi:hypothetical protein